MKVANVVKLSKRAPFISAFIFSLGEEGGSTYEASPLPLPSPLQPHCTLEVAALRAGLNLALSRLAFLNLRFQDTGLGG